MITLTSYVIMAGLFVAFLIVVTTSQR